MASARATKRATSDPTPMNQLNKDGKPLAETGEGRPLIKENTHQSSTHSTQSEARVSQGLARVRKAARERKRMQFTALLHHLTVGLLRESFYALKRKAAPGSVGHAAQIEQAIPVSIVARYTGDFQSQHDSHVAESHFGCHARESRTLGPTGTGQTKIFINDDYLVFGPAQLTGFVEQRILARGRLPVVLDLRGRGLADIDDGSALGMTGFYFGEITHDSSSRRLRRASTMARA